MRVGTALARMAAWITMAAMPLIAAALGSAAWSTWQEWPAVWSVDDALMLAGATVGAAVAAYLALTAAAMMMGALWSKGRGIPSAIRALAPGSWQRVASVAIGIGLTSGIAGPALASEAPSPGAGWADAPVATSVPVPHDVSVGWADAPPATAGQEAAVAGPGSATRSAPVPDGSVAIAPPPVATAGALAESPVPTAPSPVTAGPGAEPAPSTSGAAAVSVGWADSPGESNAAALTAQAAVPAGPHQAVPTPAAPAPAEQGAPATSVQPTLPTPTPANGERPVHAYVVQPGDSLWLITSSLLGADASDAQIASEWPRLYELNREAIGEDPSLIRPGVELAVPAELVP